VALSVLARSRGRTCGANRRRSPTCPVLATTQRIRSLSAKELRVWPLWALNPSLKSTIIQALANTKPVILSRRANQQTFALAKRPEQNYGLNRQKKEHLAPAPLMLKLTLGKRAVLSSERMKDSRRLALRALDLEHTRLMTIENEYSNRKKHK